LLEDNFLASHPFDFSNFLIIKSSPNLSFKISFALPIPSIKPNSFALLPDQNSPENNSMSFFFSLIPLLSSTTFIKSL
jgi:hypothetical protein